MRAPRGRFTTSSVLAVVALISGCAFAGTSSPTSSSCASAAAPTDTAGTAGSEGSDLVIVGRIVTMDEPAEAEALLIEAGLLIGIGTRDEVMAHAGDEERVVDLGSNVA